MILAAAKPNSELSGESSSEFTNGLNCIANLDNIRFLLVEIETGKVFVHLYSLDFRFFIF